MRWLGLDWDGDAVHQFARAGRHAEVAAQLLATGHAYKCYATPEELAALREEQRPAGRPIRYDGRWRDRHPAEATAGATLVARLHAPRVGHTTTTVRAQGYEHLPNAASDHFLLQPSDRTPTSMSPV